MTIFVSWLQPKAVETPLDIFLRKRACPNGPGQPGSGILAEQPEGYPKKSLTKVGVPCYFLGPPDENGHREKHALAVWRGAPTGCGERYVGAELRWARHTRGVGRPPEVNLARL